MKDSWFIRNDVATTITDATNDIIEYLNSDVPIECHADDINKKMERLKEDINEILSYYL